MRGVGATWGTQPEGSNARAFSSERRVTALLHVGNCASARCVARAHRGRQAADRAGVGGEHRHARRGAACEASDAVGREGAVELRALLDVEGRAGVAMAEHVGDLRHDAADAAIAGGDHHGEAAREAGSPDTDAHSGVDLGPSQHGGDGVAPVVDLPHRVEFVTRQAFGAAEAAMVVDEDDEPGLAECRRVVVDLLLHTGEAVRHHDGGGSTRVRQVEIGRESCSIFRFESELMPHVHELALVVS